MTGIADILDASAERYPHKVAVRYRTTQYTYAEMKHRVDMLTSALHELGIKRHDHVVLMSPNSNVCLELLFATARLGAVLEQYNIRLSTAVMGEVLGRSKATIAFVSNKVCKTASELIEVAGRSLTVIFLENDSNDTQKTYEELLGSAQPLKQTPETVSTDSAMVLYTSGTTGIPRGVLLSHGALLHQIKTDTQISELAHTSVVLSVLPFYHITFLSALEALYAGAELVILDVCKSGDIANAVNKFGVTHTSLVPFLLKALTVYVEDTGMKLDTLHQILYGGEPIDVIFLTRAQEALGCDFVQGYGMTETTAAITMLLPEDHKKHQHLDTVGKPLPGVTLMVANEDGSECPPMTSGEILVKTPALMRGYYHDQERTSHVVKDEWYYTGDIGYLDKEGYLHLVSRKNDMIISGGENIYPQEVSSCIKELTGVADAVVAGIPHAHWGEALVALVVRKNDSYLTQDDIIEHCANQLGGYKKPSQVFFVDKIKSSPSGKISSADLKEQIKLCMN